MYSGVKHYLWRVTLRTDAGEEFKVNGQRLKHYLSREKEKEEHQLVN